MAEELTVSGTLPYGDVSGPTTYFIIDTAGNTLVGQVVLPDAAKQFNSVSMTVRVPSASSSYAIGTFDSNGNFQSCSFLTVTSQSPRGFVGGAGR